ncbi:type I restriction endonuclease subunit R [Halobacillus sp. BBL2006]|uniref:type I restriction endonuclease subunit R n=1 Tax=Halobacillus sp. BBL2006 TaxID=1543706 RepID=UPI0005430B70|nr:DEAD/DEAH box helicase family protein [Halobacillus sp. BBL2006]KHE69670.1 restriction endonuclease subunit R [Halobacillus sp. BBL2006]
MAFEDTEKRFEQDIETFLLNEGGYVKGDELNYDKERAIDLTQLINFIQETQEKSWLRYQKIYGNEAPSKLYKRLNDEIDTNGLLHVLRYGISDRGVKLKVAAFRPESTLNEKTLKNYQSNNLTVNRQFAYSTDNHNTLDMVLSLNGIPIVAMELKNQFKGQSVEHGKKQFMYDRDPREKMFQFNKRVLVYFVADLSEVWMTTKLNGKDTFFLPFNQGSNGAGEVGGAGNPENPDGYVTSYLWEKVLQKESLMNIFHRLMHLEVKKEKVMKNGHEQNKISSKLIFPRYHQLDAVRKLINHVRQKGSGDNYLIQHSAGSGKSNSIAWLAYHLASLHDKDNKSVFNSVIIVTDRTVLDRQLQNTISSFDHTQGLVETIGEKKTSRDLKNAINDGKRIIITTLQKFPVIYEEVEVNKGNRFAVIVDEAHSSQTGSSAKKLKAALADTEEALKEYAELEAEIEENTPDHEDKLVQELLTHGRHINLSFFAFTATPKEKTLEMFGTQQADGTFRPFHVYSMRQAIEEGFILDVLQNYMTYETSYKIAKNTPDNPELSTTQGVKAIRRYQSLHPHNLQQKTAIMIEHFRNVTCKKLGGKAKAMVVTASRLHAVRYYFEFKNYIEKNGYVDMDVLVAFSGSVKDQDEEYSEDQLNKTKEGKRIKENQLKEMFNSDEFNVLVVAEKYQTGFDEPLLHTMFVDKKLSGVKAVQTLSRLNRTYPGKEDTFVLDFVNETEDIRNAFQPFYEVTELDKDIDVNLIYDTKTKLRNYNIYNDQDINKLTKLYFKNGKQMDSDLGRIASHLIPIIKRYEELDEQQQYEFRVTVRNFNKWYSYIAQLTRMFDKELHEEYIFCKYLISFIPKNSTVKIDVEDKVKLEYYKVEETFNGDITLEKNKEYKLKNPDNVDTGIKPPDDDDVLENIIRRVNEKYDGKLSESDRLIIEGVTRKAKQSNDRLKSLARSNDEEMFEKSLFPSVFEKASQELYLEQIDSYSKLFEDKSYYNSIMEAVAKEIYKELRK